MPRAISQQRAWTVGLGRTQLWILTLLCAEPTSALEVAALLYARLNRTIEPCQVKATLNRFAVLGLASPTGIRPCRFAVTRYGEQAQDEAFELLRRAGAIHGLR